eukprot:2075988-Lingulodinium_polyedra.AAC.1
MAPPAPGPAPARGFGAHRAGARAGIAPGVVDSSSRVVWASRQPCPACQLAFICPALQRPA